MILEDALEKIATKYHLRNKTGTEGIINLELPSRGAFRCELDIVADVLEWYATVYSRANGKVIWNNWMDYRGYDNKPDKSLLEDLTKDVICFIEEWMSSDAVRVIKKKTFWGLFNSKELQIYHLDEWKPIMLYDPNR